jgi:hypothetical protein
MYTDAVQFFKDVTGEEPTAAEATGNIPLDVLLKLIDARIPIAIDNEARRQAEIELSLREKIDTAIKVEPAKPDPENGASPFSEAPAGSES